MSIVCVYVLYTYIYIYIYILEENIKFSGFHEVFYCCYAREKVFGADIIVISG